MKSIAEQVEEVYRAVAQDYDRLITPCRVGQFAALLAELRLEGRERALDVGCGTGGLTLMLARSLPRGEVIGVDLCTEVLEIARRKAEAAGLGNASFRRGDALSLSFVDESFDLVVSSFLLPWVPNPDRALGEIARVLKRSGKLGLITAGSRFYDAFYRALEGLIRRYPRHYGKISAEELIGAQRFAGKELQEKLERLGFSVRCRFQLSLEDPLTPEQYLRRINALTAELYLKPLPPQRREEARRSLLSGLEELGQDRDGELLAVECSLILVGIKKGGGERK